MLHECFGGHKSIMYKNIIDSINFDTLRILLLLFFLLSLIM